MSPRRRRQAPSGGEDTPLRVDVVDYSGHPFQVQLSRALAARGHDTRHVYCSDYVSGKGRLQREPGDPDTFGVLPLSLGRLFQRYDIGARLRHELEFGFALARAVLARDPDVVVLCNIPLFAHFVVSQRLRAAGVAQVFWLQDIYSRAIRATLRKRLGRLGLKLGGLVVRVEGFSARSSDRMIVITDDFLAWTRRFGVSDDRVEVVPNWAPLSELSPTPRDNPWAVEHDLVGRPTALYSGTLGLKHDPAVLLRLAHWMREHRPDGRVVVVTEGYGRQWLEEHRDDDGPVPQLVLLDFQPYDRLPEALGAADVLIVVLEQQASVFSVPSKVLSYLCAGRAVFGVMPTENLAARTVVEIGAGVVVSNETPEVEREFGELIAADPEKIAALGAAARAHAERAFDIDTITDTVEPLLRAAVRDRRRRLRPATRGSSR